MRLVNHSVLINLIQITGIIIIKQEKQQKFDLFKNASLTDPPQKNNMNSIYK